MLRLVARLFTSLVIVGVSAPIVSAQSIGTFRWGLAPFCNVVTLHATLTDGMFTLDGFDDQCGAATRASVVGTAFPNLDGSIGIGLSIVATPGAAPVHVEVAVNLATIGGPWRDSAGNTGTFVFNPAIPAPGTARPAPSHTHGLSGGNVAVGNGALTANATGLFNTALGTSTLVANTTGTNNTAVGALVLGASTTGQHNTGVGVFSLSTLSSGSGNTAVGIASLDALTTGDSNTGMGANALPALTSGSTNIALGSAAGSVLTSGSDNIYIGTGAGAAVENSTIRIGDDGQHVATFIAGIIAQSVDAMTDRPVHIDATGKLGTTISSARFKEDIRPLDGLSDAVLRLAPVSFRYRPDQHRGGSLQYGLIAEQVADVIPELVIRDDEGRPLTVKYHILPTLLLAEIQRLERERAAQAEMMAAQAKAIEDLQEELRSRGRERD